MTKKVSDLSNRTNVSDSNLKPLTKYQYCTEIKKITWIRFCLSRLVIRWDFAAITFSDFPFFRKLDSRKSKFILKYSEFSQKKISIRYSTWPSVSRFDCHIQLRPIPNQNRQKWLQFSQKSSDLRPNLNLSYGRSKNFGQILSAGVLPLHKLELHS